MTTDDFKSAVEISKTRTAMNLRLGEVISAIIGDGRVKELFDKAGKHPDEYAGQATGEMALKLNVITPDTKTALLVAQAAERAYRLAEKAESYAQNHENLVGYYRKKNKGVATEKILLIDEKAVGVVGYDDPVFKFVGSEKDPELLKAAQATWMGAQIYLNQEIHAINTAGLGLDGEDSMGAKFADGFKKAAAAFYTQAARLLDQEGHTAAAEKLKAVSKELDSRVKNQNPPMPSAFTDYIYHYNRELFLGTAMTQEKEAIFKKLVKLTAPPPEPKTGPQS
ncbi:MAG: hypothetical protein K8R48_05260 [Alphaproteobacteria bacterium]|nr:hypothetical protein [Alphaproteobacteria bacterium]